MSDKTWQIDFTDASGCGAKAIINAEGWTDHDGWVRCGGHAFANDRVRCIIQIAPQDFPAAIVTPLDPCSAENRGDVIAQVRKALDDALERQCLVEKRLAEATKEESPRWWMP